MNFKKFLRSPVIEGGMLSCCLSRNHTLRSAGSRNWQSSDQLTLFKSCVIQLFFFVPLLTNRCDTVWSCATLRYCSSLRWAEKSRLCLSVFQLLSLCGCNCINIMCLFNQYLISDHFSWWSWSALCQYDIEYWLMTLLQGATTHVRTVSIGEKRQPAPSSHATVNKNHPLIMPSPKSTQGARYASTIYFECWLSLLESKY